MSKYLYLIRHAKSSWEDSSLRDFDRPLNKRGLRDAPEMGRRLAEKQVLADLMLTSPANRALTTCKLIAAEIDFPQEAIEKDDDIYHAGPSTLLDVINDIDNTWRTVLLFGHNPGFTDLANQLNGTNIDNIPTCGIVLCKFDTDSWEEIRFGSGTQLFFDFPKNR